MSVKPSQNWKYVPARNPKVEPQSTLDYFAKNNKHFVKACELAKVKPTKRQASKWHRKEGLAFAKREEAKHALSSAEQS